MSASPPDRLLGPLLLSLFAAITLACSLDDSPRIFSEWDSAGIRIVETHSPAWEQGGQWTVSPTPILEIGEREGEEALQFYGVTGGRRLSDGGFVILNSSSHTVRLFTGDGRFIREFGGEGDGPGEFRDLSSVSVLPGDTLLIWDQRQRRVSLLASSGEHLRSYRFVWAGGGQMTGVLPFPDERSIVETYASPFPRGLESGLGIHRGVAPLLLFDRNGSLLDTIGVFPNFEAAIMQAEGRPVVADAPLAKDFFFDVWQESIVVGTAERMEVEVWDAVQGLVSIYRYPHLDLTFSQADLDWYLSAYLDAYIPPERQEEARADLRAPPFAATRAAFAELKVDTEGNIWLRTGRNFYHYAQSTEWTVFSSSGVFLGTISLPERFTVLEIRAQEILGVWKDDLDVEFIRVYELHKGGDLQ